jgi:hypothetical protein
MTEEPKETKEDEEDLTDPALDQETMNWSVKFGRVHSYDFQQEYDRQKGR